ncbi:DHH family phosphoesterase [Paenibacillus daejeonensis]|uniref:DHH family phosphoesterase n=1 Tax=Paenibacillus daejeonensis TaxID=135193 RepID=UPI0003741DEA|nr:bifunctional oligoribonuclease/PAP phosphatase NrnA [Paenibacillus daejeonensis]
MTEHAAAYVRQLEEAYSFMASRDDFLVVSHVQPDGDAISSTVLIGWLLGRLGKRAVLVNEGAVPSRLSYLTLADSITCVKEHPLDRSFTHIISIDCADFRRIGIVSQSFAEDAQLLNIDHHPTNDAFGTVNLIRPDAAATVEILYDLIAHQGIELDLEAATAVYTGLLTDTGGFRYSNTTPHVMEIASELLRIGVSGNQLADHLLEKMTMPQLRLLQRALSRLSFTDDGRISWLFIEPADLADTGATGEDLEGLVNYALNVEGVEVGILYKGTEDGHTKVSFRSAGKANVAAVAQTFGGGGHVRAAGCRIEGQVPDVISMVVESVRRALG